MAYEHELALAEQAARKAGEALRNWRGAELTVLSQAGRDVKLQADRDAEAIVLETLSASGLPVLAEESGVAGNVTSGPYWVVDPLDGTVNYSRGLPISGVSIALAQGHESLAGAVYDFHRDELFAARRGANATCNGQAIRVAAPRPRSQSILCTGFPTKLDHGDASLRAAVELVQSFKKVRMLGSAALMLAYVAAGRADAYLENKVRFWDVAAGVLLIQCAGGYVDMRPVDDVPWGIELRCASHAALWET